MNYNSYKSNQIAYHIPIGEHLCNFGFMKFGSFRRSMYVIQSRSVSINLHSFGNFS